MISRNESSRRNFLIYSKMESLDKLNKKIFKSLGTLVKHTFLFQFKFSLKYISENRISLKKSLM